MVWGTYVGGDQESFLRLAMTQVVGLFLGLAIAQTCGNWVIITCCLSQQQWGRLVGTMFFLRLTTARVGISFAPAAVK